MADAHGMNDVRGPDAWFKDLPLVTRYWFGGSIACTLAVNFEIVSPYLIPFVWENVKNKFELWRLLSCFLYVGPVRGSTSAAQTASSNKVLCDTLHD